VSTSNVEGTSCNLVSFGAALNEKSEFVHKEKLFMKLKLDAFKIFLNLLKVSLIK